MDLEEIAEVLEETPAHALLSSRSWRLAAASYIRDLLLDMDEASRGEDA